MRIAGRLALGLGLAVVVLLSGCTGGAGPGPPSPSATTSSGTETVRPGECPALFTETFAQNYGVAEVDAARLPDGMSMPEQPSPSCVLSAGADVVQSDPRLSTRPWIVVYFGGDAASRAALLVAIEATATARGYSSSVPDPAQSDLPEGSDAVQYASPPAADGTGWDLQVLTLSSGDGAEESSVVVIGAETLLS